MEILNSINNVKTFIISFLLVLVGFHICYGLEVIFPTNINWIIDRKSVV